MLCWRSSFGASSMSESEERESRKKSESEGEPPPNKRSDIDSEGSSSDARTNNNTITRHNRTNGYHQAESNFAKASPSSPSTTLKKTATPPSSPAHRTSHNMDTKHSNTHRYHRNQNSTDSESEVLSSSLTSSTECIPDLSVVFTTYFPWEALPSELLALIWESLPLEDVVRLSMVCRSWRNLSRNLSDALWKRFHKRYFGGPKANGGTWKTDFVKQLQKRQALFSPRHWDSSRVPAILEWVAQSGHYVVLSYTVKRVPRLEYRNKASGAYAALLIAAGKGHLKVVYFLLQMGASPIFDRGTSPFHVAAEHGHLEVLKLLLNPPPPYDAAGGGQHPQHQQQSDGGDMLYVLDKKGNTPLLLACKRGHLDVVNYLYPLSVRIGETPREAPVEREGGVGGEKEREKGGVAAQGNNTNNGLHTNYVSTYRFTKKQPLHTAARGGRLEVVRYLVVVCREGVDSLHGKQATPLHFASKGGHVDVMAFLVDAGANINSRNKRGRTPIFVASLYGCNKAVAFLIEKGADVDLATFHGETPLSVALKFERRGIASLLLSHGAKQ